MSPSSAAAPSSRRSVGSPAPSGSATGTPFSDYVNRMKTESAAALLLYSEYSDLDISNLFAFSSQSYFIKVFRRYMGMTPKEYKKTYRMPDVASDQKPLEETT